MDHADLHFEENGSPRSKSFEDVYFQNGQGLDESNYIFIEQNHLVQRFQSLKKNQHFTVAETGFGTGLNFLNTWQTFIQHAQKDARLTFVSCEKFPIQPEDLETALKQWPELADLSEQLLAQYPPMLEGFHLLEFGPVNLLLLYGDAVESLAELTANVDAWFLDGFSPSRNPDMWQPAFIPANESFEPCWHDGGNLCRCSVCQRRLKSSWVSLRNSFWFW